MSLLRLTDVSKNFGGLWALQHVSLTVAAGSIHGLMGANGAGKTTLFSIVAGNQTSTGGSIEFDGQRLNGRRPDQICRMGIARTFQIVRPFPTMTVRQNIETAALFGNAIPPARETLPEIVARVLDDVGLTADPESMAGTLTLSDRKRLEIARALATGPRLLMLDEVMAGLTATEVSEMIEAVRRIRDGYGLTILIVEHVVQALATLSERITVLHHGEKIAEGDPDEIAADADVQAAYFGADD